MYNRSTTEVQVLCVRGALYTEVLLHNTFMFNRNNCTVSQVPSASCTTGYRELGKKPLVHKALGHSYTVHLFLLNINVLCRRTFCLKVCVSVYNRSTTEVQVPCVRGAIPNREGLQTPRFVISYKPKLFGVPEREKVWARWPGIIIVKNT